MSCEVCRAAGPRFCLPCRRKYGGKVVRVTRATKRATPAQRSAPAAKRARKAKATPAARKHLSREAFLKRMRAGRVKAARARAAGGRK